MNIDTASETWESVMGFCQDELVILAAQNELDLDQLDTAKIRGMMLFARKVIALQDKETILPVKGTVYLD